MFPIRDILDTVRLAAVWLLIVSVFFGVAGLGRSSARAEGSNPCGVSCPCDKAPQDDGHADGDADHAGAVEDAAPCDQECPEGCPNCGCCPVVAMAMVPLTIPLDSPLSATDRTLAPPDTPKVGAFNGVFRPPRSLI